MRILRDRALTSSQNNTTSHSNPSQTRLESRLRDRAERSNGSHVGQYSPSTPRKVTALNDQLVFNHSTPKAQHFHKKTIHSLLVAEGDKYNSPGSPRPRVRFQKALRPQRGRMELWIKTGFASIMAENYVAFTLRLLCLTTLANLIHQSGKPTGVLCCLLFFARFQSFAPAG